MTLRKRRRRGGVARSSTAWQSTWGQWEKLAMWRHNEARDGTMWQNGGVMGRVQDW